MTALYFWLITSVQLVYHSRLQFLYYRYKSLMMFLAELAIMTMWFMNKTVKFLLYFFTRFLQKNF